MTFVRSNAWLLAALTIVAAGCAKKPIPTVSKVEIKRDSPTATVATLIKLFSEGDDSQWAEVVDPVTTRARARRTECYAEIKEADDCLIYALQHNGTYSGACERAKPISDCTCGPRGDSAASKAPDFRDGYQHAGLKLAKVSKKSCRITDSGDLTSKTVGAMTAKGTMHFWDLVCGDLKKEEPLASVTVSCSGAAHPIVFVLRAKDQEWKVVGFADETDLALSLTSMAAEGAAAAKKRRAELNKDLD